MTRKHDTTKHRKQVKKEKANRRAKKAIVIVDEREKEIIDKLRECPDIEVKPMSPARRAFQDV